MCTTCSDRQGGRRQASAPPWGKPRRQNSVERELKAGKDKKGGANARRVVYAVDPKAWHTQRVFNDVWMPGVLGQRPGRGDRATNYRAADSLLSWDDNTVH